jgi:hypothetical protein
MPIPKSPKPSSLARERKSTNSPAFFWASTSDVPSYEDIRKLFLIGALAVERRALACTSLPLRRILNRVEEGSMTLSGLMEGNGHRWGDTK